MSKFDHYLQRLIRSLELDDRVLGLVGLGSSADESLRDRWSDLDFWVVCRPEAKEGLIEDLSWLPEYDCLSLKIRVVNNYFTTLTSDGLMLEFGVLAPDEVGEARSSRIQVYIDKGGITDLLAKAIPNPPTADEALIERTISYLLISLWVGLGRYHRGEVIGSRKYIYLDAIQDLLLLIVSLLPPEVPYKRDPFDPKRRFEQGYPSLSQRIHPIYQQDATAAARSILGLLSEILDDEQLESFRDAIDQVSAIAA